MIAKITRSTSGGDLARYLFGPGRENEHEQGRVIATSDGMTIPLGVTLEQTEVTELGWMLDAPASLFGVEVAGGHIWHLSLTTPTGDRELTDAEWSRIVYGAMDRMGFNPSGENVGVPWVAVRHGASTGGNEHVHIAVSLVGEDGSRARIGWDWPAMGEYCSQVEQSFGLVDVGARLGVPAPKRAEIEMAAKQGLVEPARLTLSRKVRAAATPSRDEAHFVQRLRDAPGVLVEPHMLDGGGVVGYKVALVPKEGHQAVWYGGGKLGKDLSLPRLRAHWDQSPEARRAAMGEWHSRKTEKAGRLPVSEWQVAADRAKLVSSYLDGIPAGDRGQWGSASRELAGVYAQLADRFEAVPGRFAHASDVLARAAQRPRGGTELARTGAVRDLRGVADVVGRGSPGGGVAVDDLVGALGRTVAKIGAHHEAIGDLHTAANLAKASQRASRTTSVHLGKADRMAKKSLGMDPATVREVETQHRDRGRGFDRG